MLVLTGLLWLLSAPSLFARPFQENPAGNTSGVVTSQESAAVRDYGNTLSKEWLKKIFSIDVDAFDLALQNLKIGDVDFKSLDSKTKFGSMAVSQSQPGQALETTEKKRAYGFMLKVTRIGDIRQWAYDSRDIPFALRMDTDRLIGGAGMKMETSLSVPMSGKGGLEASASLPLGVLDASGFGTSWKLSSIYASQLGISSVDTGLGTRWMGDWDLGFDSRIRFGTGTYETSQWLKLGRTF